MDNDILNLNNVDTKEIIKEKLASGNRKLLTTKNRIAEFWNNFEKNAY